MAKKEVKTDLWVARQLDDSKIKNMTLKVAMLRKSMTLYRVHQSVVLATLDTPSMLQLLKILLLSSRTKLILPSIRS